MKKRMRFRRIVIYAHAQSLVGTLLCGMLIWRRNLEYETLIAISK